MAQQKFKYLNDPDPWYLGEHVPDIDFQFSQIWLSSFVNDLEKTVGRNYKKILCVYHGYNLKFYYGQKDSDQFAAHLLKLITQNPKFGKKINDSIRKYSDDLKLAAADINPENLGRMANKELADFYKKLDYIHTRLYTWGWLPNAVDMFHGNFTAFLKSELAKKIGDDGVNEILVVLQTMPEKSILNQERESFLRLAAIKQNGLPRQQFEQALREHLDRFFYLKHLWIGKEGVYDKGYYAKEVSKFLKGRDKANLILMNEDRALKDALKKKSQLIKKLKLSKKLVAILDVYGEFAVTKLYRRDAQIYWAYMMNNMFRELGRRLGTTFMQARFMFPDEVTKALQTGKLDSKLKNELKQRVKYCVYYAEKGRDWLTVGNEAKKLEDLIKDEVGSDVTELNGQTACLGKVTGAVKIVNSVNDMKKMNKGDILVSIATNPDVVPAMKKAGAIVTEQGGITSHAAIVSRELGIPCVIGTKIATKVFKDGDMVEVDANKGTIKIINDN